MLVLDLTRPLDESTPIYRDALGYADPPTRLTTWIDVGDAVGGSGRRSPFRVTSLEMSLHTGTHVDAPAHFASGGATLDALPASALVGSAVVVDLSKVTGTTRQTLDDALKQATAAGATLPPMLTYHYWIDADGLVRRVAYDALGTSTQMTFSGWGEPVDIQAPKADQIANLDKS